ncbi:RHS repeat protein [Salmonella enterica subsp. enterica serovar Nigeria]|nr:RHS repeat protein [Salmonella enterica subsp. enterica serovar Nigeria]
MKQTPADNYDVDAELARDPENKFALFVKCEQIAGYDQPGFTEKRFADTLAQYRKTLSGLTESALTVYRALAKLGPNNGHVNLTDITRNLYSRNKGAQPGKGIPVYAECPLANKIHFKYGVQFKGFIPLGNLDIYATPVKMVMKEEQMYNGKYLIPRMLPDGKTEKYTLNDDGEVDIPGESGKTYLIEVEPLTCEDDVRAWTASYQPCIEAMVKWLETQWQTALLPEWKAYLAMNASARYVQVTQARSDGFWDSAGKSIRTAFDDFSGWIQENSVYLRAGAESANGYITEETQHDLAVKIKSDLQKAEEKKYAPLPLTIQDEPTIFFHVYAMQCWQRLLPPHMAAYISGQEMYKIASAVLEFIILTALGEAGFALAGRALKVVKNAVAEIRGASTPTAVHTATVLENAMLSVSEKITLSDKSRRMLSGSASGENTAVQVTTTGIQTERSVQSIAQTETVANNVVKTTTTKNEAEKVTLKNSSVETTGDPVSMQTGEELLQLDDARLPGVLPLCFSRLYRTSAVGTDCGLGPGWSHSLSHELTFDGDTVVWRDHEGLRVTFPEPQDTRPHLINPLAEAAIYREPNGQDYVLAQASGAGFYHFRRQKARARLTAISDAYGNRLEVTYDAAGRIAYVCNRNSALRLAFVYNDSDSTHIYAVQIQRFYLHLRENESAWHPEQTVIQYGYNESGQLVSATNVAGETEQYLYDDQHRIVQRTMAGGAAFYWQWEGEGKHSRCIRHWGNFDALDHRYRWDDDSRTTTVITAKGEQRVYQHNAQARLISKTGADGDQTRYEYDDSGNLLAEISPSGWVTRYDYDALGQKVAEHFPDGRSRTYRWSGGRICRMEEGLRVWRWQYNDYGDLLTAINPLRQETHHRYNARGQRTETRLPDGTTHCWQWGDEGELLEESRSDGFSRRYEYDALLRVVTVADADRQRTQYHYDKAGRVTEIRFPDETTREYRYNAYGKVTWMKDEAGKTTTYDYAAPLHLLTKKTLPDGSTLHYRYDNDHLQVSEIRNQKGERYRLNYTPGGLLCEETGFDNVKTTYHYDADGRLSEKREYGDRHDDAPLVTAYQRDAVGRVTKKTFPDGGEEHYHYDRHGQLTRVQDSAGNVLAWEYDECSRLTAEHQNWATLRHQYDEYTGQHTGTRMPDGQMVGYHWREGQIWGVTLDRQPLTAFRYDNCGRLTERRQHNMLTTRFSYDDRGRLSSNRVLERLHEAPHSQLRWQQDYRYTPDSELVDIRGSNEREYQYDANGRLTSAIEPEWSSSHAARTETFHYDSTGNRIAAQDAQQLEDWAREYGHNPAEAVESRPEFAKGNRLESYGERRFEYDRFGNLTAERWLNGLCTLYEYDCRHRLIKYTAPSGMTARYTYDAFNRRLSKTPHDGTLTEFIWQGNKLVAQSQDNERNWQTFLYEPGSHRPLVLIDGNKNTLPKHLEPKVYWYHNDHLGTPHSLTNINGEEVYRCQFDAYGNLVEEETVTHWETGERLISFRNPLRFQGQYEDEESGLFYNLNRYYQPELGRYITPDPIKLAGGLNSYQYVDDNPTNSIDPLGLDVISIKTSTSPEPVINSPVTMNSSNKGMGIEPAPPELVDAVSRRRSVMIATEGSEELRYLDMIGAEANVGGETMTHILLRENASKAAILEEFLHGTQFRLGIVNRLGHVGMGSAETHVKNFMINHKRMLGLSDEDIKLLAELRDMGL